MIPEDVRFRRIAQAPARVRGIEHQRTRHKVAEDEKVQGTALLEGVTPCGCLKGPIGSDAERAVAEHHASSAEEQRFERDAGVHGDDVVALENELSGVLRCVRRAECL